MHINIKLAKMHTLKVMCTWTTLHYD